MLGRNTPRRRRGCPRAVEQTEASRTGARHAGEPASRKSRNDAEHIRDRRRDRDCGRFEIIALGCEPGKQCVAVSFLVHMPSIKPKPRCCDFLSPIEMGCCRFRLLHRVAETRIYAVSARRGLGWRVEESWPDGAASLDPQPLPTIGRGGVCGAVRI